MAARWRPGRHCSIRAQVAAVQHRGGPGAPPWRSNSAAVGVLGIPLGRLIRGVETANERRLGWTLCRRWRRCFLLARPRGLQRSKPMGRSHRAGRKRRGPPSIGSCTGSSRIAPADGHGCSYGSGKVRRRPGSGLSSEPRPGIPADLHSGVHPDGSNGLRGGIRCRSPNGACAAWANPCVVVPACQGPFVCQDDKHRPESCRYSSVMGSPLRAPGRPR